MYICNSIRQMSLEFPGISYTYCVKCIGYMGRSDNYYCSTCHDQPDRDLDTVYINCHGFEYGKPDIACCEICQRSVSTVQPVISCEPCLSKYLTLFRKLRDVGVRISDIYNIIYSHRAESVVQIVGTDSLLEILFPHVYVNISAM